MESWSTPTNFLEMLRFGNLAEALATSPPQMVRSGGFIALVSLLLLVLAIIALIASIQSKSHRESWVGRALFLGAMSAVSGLYSSYTGWLAVSRVLENAQTEPNIEGLTRSANIMLWCIAVPLIGFLCVATGTAVASFSNKDRDSHRTL